MSEIELIPTFAKLGLSFLLGFCLGALARRTVRLAVVLSVYVFIALGYLKFTNIITLNVGLIADWYNNVLEYITSQDVSDSIKYVSDPLSVFGGFAVGLIAGYYIS